MSSYPHLLTPITFGRHLTVSSRMYFSSVGFDLCDPEGMPYPDFFQEYESIMDGGLGFGFLGNASVDPDSQYTDRSLKLVSSEHASRLLPLIKSAEKKGVPLVLNLQHYGMQGAEVRSVPPRLKAKADANTMSVAQIEACIEHFRVAACLALDIGAHGIQVHAANGYLLSSFLSQRTNARTDCWGGTPLKRARILLEILRRIRSSTKEKIAIFVRLQVDDGYGAAGLQVEHLDEVMGAIEEAGADAITCATGVAATFGKFLGNREYTVSVICKAARYLKARTSIPIGFAANIDNLSEAERFLADGDADFIGFGRAIIADHEFALKELSGRSREVHRCHWDSYCLRDKREPLAHRVYCCVNPRYLRPQHIQTHYLKSQK